MQLDILICTIDSGIERVPQVLMPPRPEVRYVVSMQHTHPRWLNHIPTALRTRPDVTIATLEGRGLSRNRNNAIFHATGDILLLADDDNRYTAQMVENILNTFRHESQTDIICFAAQTHEGQPLKDYPTHSMSYARAFRAGYYPSSVEIAFRRHVATRFDPRFGLASPHLCAGEEDVFLKDAQDQGYTIRFVPLTVVSTQGATTGQNFLHNPRLQYTKGAVFRHLFGFGHAWWRTLRETAWWAIHRQANPFPIFYHMAKGILLYH